MTQDLCSTMCQSQIFPRVPWEAREISDGAIISLDFQMGNLRTREGKSVSVDTQQMIGGDRTG